jgi:hypothetical protein
MRFEYKPYEDRSIGTIAELMLRSGQLSADRAERLAAIAANVELQRGQTQAQAAALRGQIVGQTIGSITQNLAAIPGNIEAQKRTKLAADELKLRQEAGARTQAEADRQQADRDALRQAQQSKWLTPEGAPWGTAPPMAPPTFGQMTDPDGAPYPAPGPAMPPVGQVSDPDGRA